MAEDTAFVITGRHISTATKIGTFEEVNQKIANSIKETTGVTLTIFMGSEKKASNEGLIPQSKPRINDRNNEIANATKQRNIVIFMCNQKS